MVVPLVIYLVDWTPSVCVRPIVQGGGGHAWTVGIACSTILISDWRIVRVLHLSPLLITASCKLLFESEIPANDFFFLPAMSKSRNLRFSKRALKFADRQLNKKQEVWLIIITPLDSFFGVIMGELRNLIGCDVIMRCSGFATPRVS